MNAALQSASPMSSLAPLDVWIAIKTVLRRELGEGEWEMWIQHARLWRVLSEGSHDQTLGVLMPRNGRAIYGAQRYIRRVRALARKMMFGVIISIATDTDERQLAHQTIQAMEDGTRKRKLLERWEDAQIWLSHPFLEPPCSPLWRNQ